MADYCTTGQVLVELALRDVDADSDPSTADVDQYCADITAEMDGRMHAVGIDTPVTDPDLLPRLQLIAVNGVAAKLLRSKTVKGGDPEWAETYQALYDAQMARIEERPSYIRETDTPGHPQGTARDDDDIKFTRTGQEW